MSTWSLHLCVLVYLLWKGTLQDAEGDTWTLTSHKILDLQSVLLAGCAEAMVAQNLWEWPTNVQFNLRFTL